MISSRLPIRRLRSDEDILLLPAGEKGSGGVNRFFSRERKANFPYIGDGLAEDSGESVAGDSGEGVNGDEGVITD